MSKSLKDLHPGVSDEDIEAGTKAVNDFLYGEEPKEDYFEESAKEIERFDKAKAALESRYMYKLKGIEELSLFLPADELLEVIRYAYSESDEREKPLTAQDALYLMLRNYMEMRRKAWAGEQLLDTLGALIDQHANRSARGALPNPEEWPTYPEQPAVGIISQEINPRQV